MPAAVRQPFDCSSGRGRDGFLWVCSIACLHSRSGRVYGHCRKRQAPRPTQADRNLLVRLDSGQPVIGLIPQTRRLCLSPRANLFRALDSSHGCMPSPVIEEFAARVIRPPLESRPRQTSPRPVGHLVGDSLGRKNTEPSARHSGGRGVGASETVTIRAAVVEEIRDDWRATRAGELPTVGGDPGRGLVGQQDGRLPETHTPVRRGRRMGAPAHRSEVPRKGVRPIRGRSQM